MGGRHKLVHRSETEVDLVPFGGVADADGAIAWPSEDEPEMSVLGFEEALATSIQVLLPGRQIVDIVCLPAFVMLKIIAWPERHTRRPGVDAQDLFLVLSHYIDCDNQERLFDEHDDLLSRSDFDYELAGSIMAGQDLRRLLEEQRTRTGLRLSGSVMIRLILPLPPSRVLTVMPSRSFFLCCLIVSISKPPMKITSFFLNLSQPAWGVQPTLTAAFAGVYTNASTTGSRARPFLMARYDFALNRFAGTTEWNRTTHDASAELAPAFGKVRLRLGAGVRLGAWTEDRQAADQIILRPQIEFRPSPVHLLNGYVVVSARRIDVGVETRSDTFRLAGVGYYLWWRGGGLRHGHGLRRAAPRRRSDRDVAGVAGRRDDRCRAGQGHRGLQRNHEHAALGPWALLPRRRPTPVCGSPTSRP